MTLPDDDPHAWLETDAIRRVSDIALGVILLIIGAFALWHAPGDDAGDLEGLGPGFFPSVVAGLLCAVAVLTLLRAALRRSPPVRGARPPHVLIIATVVVALVFAVWTWGGLFVLRFGAPEIMALVVLELAIAIALAHSSRIRAAGMVLLGLLLSTVGIDAISGELRFTMGMEALLGGIDVDILFVGLFLVGDALVCLASPQLLLRTYMRLILAWRTSQMPGYVSFVMRLAAAVVLASAPYFAYALSHRYSDVVLVVVFGILGVAAKIFGWNRLLLYMGVLFGTMLEGQLRSSMLALRGDAVALLQEPMSGTMLVAAIAVFAGAMVLSLRRARARDS
jgi:TctA family transporter